LLELLEDHTTVKSWLELRDLLMDKPVSLGKSHLEKTHQLLLLSRRKKLQLQPTSLSSTSLIPPSLPFL
jgi:hypothetical protein